MAFPRIARPATAILLACFLLLSACGKQAGPGGPQGGPPPGPPPVTAAAAIEREVIDEEDFPGRLEAVQQVDVRARVTGYLQAVHVKPGALVRKGDALFDIDARPFRAELARAAASLADTRAQLDLARSERARSEKLLADQATSQREHDELTARVRTLEARLQSAQAAVEQAQLNLSFTHVVAPIAGRVGKAEITEGNLVQGEVPNSPVLTTVVSVDPVYVSFDADERAYLKFVAQARGRTAQLPVGVGLADESGYPHTGRMDFIDNRLDIGSGTVRMRAVLDNPEGRLTPGLYARVRLGDAGGRHRAVLVADRAIGTDQSKRFVLVVGADHKALYREVRPGRLVGSLRVIESGLRAGELIIVNGLQRARPGAPVAPETVAMDAGDAAPATR